MKMIAWTDTVEMGPVHSNPQCKVLGRLTPFTCFIILMLPIDWAQPLNRIWGQWYR